MSAGRIAMRGTLILAWLASFCCENFERSLRSNSGLVVIFRCNSGKCDVWVGV